MHNPPRAAAASDDTIRALPEPDLPNDPWGMQEFTWWLVLCEHVPESPLSALADELYLSEEFLEGIPRLFKTRDKSSSTGRPAPGRHPQRASSMTTSDAVAGTVEEIPFYASYSYEDLIGACRRGGTRTAHKPGGQGDLVGRGARSTRRSSGATPTSSGRLLCGSSVLASSRGSRSVTPSTTAT